MTEHNQKRFVKESIYHLKRSYGSKITIYHVTSVTDNPETGETVITKIAHIIRKAVVLPTELAKEMNIIGGYRRVSPDFPNTPTDIITRVILIDNDDLPLGFEWNQEDYLVINKDRYEIDKMMELEDNYVTMITAKFLKGTRPNEILSSNLENFIILVENLTVVKS